METYIDISDECIQGCLDFSKFVKDDERYSHYNWENLEERLRDYQKNYKVSSFGADSPRVGASLLLKVVKGRSYTFDHGNIFLHKKNLGITKSTYYGQ